ncbi:unnamed protein product [Parajaminaea phylloscopi]
MSTLGLLSPAGEANTTASSASYGDHSSPRRPLTPIIFAGPGSNLYPLCDPYSSSSSDSLPKALLPVANRPLISLPLQQLVSAGIKHALVLAPANQHRIIEAALKTVRLQVPHGVSSSTSKGQSHSSQSSSSIAVFDGLSPSLASATARAKAAESAAILVDLLPLGPYDGKTVTHADNEDDEDEDNTASDFRRIARPGTAELLRWISSIGKLESDPLILPVDFLTPSFSLSSFLLSYYSASDPSPPTVTALLYERGAGETVGREREKEGPARTLSAWASTTGDAAMRVSTSSQPLLLLSEPPVASSPLDIRLSLLEANPRARFSTALLDSHVYILRKAQVIPLLNARRDFTSIREHVVPFLAKASWQQGLAAKAGWKLPESSRGAGSLATDPAAFLNGANPDFEDLNDASASEAVRGQALMRLAFEKSSLSSPSSDDGSSIRAVACLARLGDDQQRAVRLAKESSSTPTKQRNDSAAADNEAEERFFARANTLPTYLECNRYLLRSLYAAGQSQRPLAFPLPSFAAPPSQGQRNEISSSAQLSPDTLLAPDSLIKIGDRSSLKRCILSARTTVGRNVRLAGCILMEGAHVADGAKLENCILGPKSKVTERVTLKDSDVGFGGVVKRDGKGEKISREEDESDGDSDAGGQTFGAE